MIDTCYIGDVRDGLRAFIAAGIRAQTVITSPPYWALRSYLPDDHPHKALELGLEPTPGEYLEKMVAVFRLVRDCMADDGTLWLNMGDSYAGSRCGGDGDTGLQGSRATQDKAKDAKRAVRASFRRDRAVTPRSDIKSPGLKAKDMVGMPWRLALALQDDGWWLRSDIIWHKKNPMPESCTDRPTKSHEYLFLLAKSEMYYYNAKAIAEPASPDTHERYARGRSAAHKYADGGPGNQTIAKGFEHMRDDVVRDDGQLLKPVAGWATGTPDHTAIGHAQAKEGRDGKLLTDRRPKAWDNDMGSHRTLADGYARKTYPGNGVGFGHGYDDNVKPRVACVTPKSAAPDSGIRANESFHAAVGDLVASRNKRTVWTLATEPFSEAHFATFPAALIEPCVLAGSRPGDIVLDPFLGSGTTAQVAIDHGRHWIGCDIDERNAAMQAGRTRQTGLAFG